jgi:hypothetical protein
MIEKNIFQLPAKDYKKSDWWNKNSEEIKEVPIPFRSDFQIEIEGKELFWYQHFADKNIKKDYEWVFLRRGTGMFADDYLILLPSSIDPISLNLQRHKEIADDLSTYPVWDETKYYIEITDGNSPITCRRCSDGKQFPVPEIILNNYGLYKAAPLEYIIKNALFDLVEETS